MPGHGFSLAMQIRLDALTAGQVLVDATDASGRGWQVRTAGEGRLEIVLSDGKNSARWASDPGLFERGRTQHVVITVDGGPKTVMFVVDGTLCDGGRGPAMWLGPLCCRPAGRERRRRSDSAIHAAGRACVVAILRPARCATSRPWSSLETPRPSDR